MQQVSKPTGEQHWNASGSWGGEDDGGWSQGPPSAGSGWMAGVVQAAASSGGHDLNWGQAPFGNTDWQSPKPNIVVDRNDKEAWPSIGGVDHSENTSENSDDNASVKSGSVISVSSNQGLDKSSSGSSAIHSQSASSLWSTPSNFNGMDSSTWSSIPNSTAASVSSMANWGSSITSLSANNQGHNMQVTSSAAGVDQGDVNNSNSRMSSGNWGNPGTLPQGVSQNQGGSRPQNLVQIPQTSLAGSNVSNAGQTVRQGQQGGALQQQNGPQMSTAAIVSQTGQGINSSVMAQQSSTANNSAFQGISASSVFSSKSQAELAWGSVGSAATTQSGVNNTGIGSDAANAGKGNGNNGQQLKSNESGGSGWGLPPPTENEAKGTDGWSGNPVPGNDWGNSASSSAQWGAQIQTSKPPPPQQWPAGSTVTGQNPNPPRSQPPTWAQAAGKGLNTNPSITTTSNPSASGDGMTHNNMQPNVQSTPEDDEISRAIESHDGWGKRPVRQDTSWDMSPVPKTQRKPSTTAEKPPNPNNMWNNNSGTAIWEASKENSAQWNTAAAAGGNASSGQWDNVSARTDPKTWPAGPPKPPNNVSDPTQWGGPPKDASQQPGAGGQWAGKTEVGSWGGNAGEQPGISTWGEQGGRREVDNGTALWNSGSMQKPPPGPGNWNSAPSQPNTPITPNLNNAPMPGVRPEDWNRAKHPNWVENPSQPNLKPDDRNWPGSQQQQTRPGGWGEASQVSQWNPKQSTSSSTSSWGEEWNPSNERKDDMMWNDDGSTNCDDADMGTWNDTTQENNSSWSSATGWKAGRRNLNKMDAGVAQFPGGNPPQMRSRLLQQMMEMGFRKDEAQHALINNNMSFNHALADLYKQKGAMKNDDVFNVDGAKPKLPGMDLGATENNDISDTQSESNPFVPNINSMQNTPFPNAQSQLPNQFIPNSMKGPSLTQSSQNNPSIIMPQQQRHIQEKFKQQSMNVPPPLPPPTQGMVGLGPPGTGTLAPNQATVQQQMVQQQILQQLHLAVKAGLISPALLNRQLPHTMLVMLQQLLQQQQCLQQFITTQQLLQQNKMNQNPLVQRQQLDQINGKINAIKQQILHLQRQISEAQRLILPPKHSASAPPVNPPTIQSDLDPMSTLPSDMSNLSLQQQQQQQQQQPQQQQLQSQQQQQQPTSQPQPQSKLSQWKRSPTDKECTPTSSSAETNQTATSAADNSALNKAVGSKPNLNHSQSTPNLKYGDLGLTNLGGDPTWSNLTSSASSSQNWPSAIGTTSSSMATMDNSSTVTSSAKTFPTSTEANKESQNASSSSSGSVLNINDSIPEFVPGKPWQGNIKSVEDDPHITPGSFSRSYSLTAPKDDDIASLGKNQVDNVPWNSKTAPPMPMGKQWSGDMGTPTSFSNEVWGVPLPKHNASRPPPGLHPGKAGGWNPGVSRQHSWAGNTNQSGWDGRSNQAVTNCLLLRNLTPQTDGSTLRTLCMQHGPLSSFHLLLSQGQALVRYGTIEEAFKAQKSLHTCVLGNTTIMAEFVSDGDFVRLEQSNMSTSQSHQGQWSQSQPPQYRHSMSVGGGGGHRGGSGNGGPDVSSWNSPSVVPIAPGANSSYQSTNMWGASGVNSQGLWPGMGAIEENSASLLGNMNMLGESM